MIENQGDSKKKTPIKMEAVPKFDVANIIPCFAEPDKFLTGQFSSKKASYQEGLDDLG